MHTIIHWAQLVLLWGTSPKDDLSILTQSAYVMCKHPGLTGQVRP